MFPRVQHPGSDDAHGNSENFISKDGDNCKKVKFNEPLRLSGIDKGTDVSLDLCKINENYELSSIYISSS